MQNRETTIHLHHPEDPGEVDCPVCGNPKSMKACPACSKEMSRLDYARKASTNTLSTDKENISIRRRTPPPEIPKDKDGNPRYGFGNPKFDEQRKRLSGSSKH